MAGVFHLFSHAERADQPEQGVSLAIGCINGLAVFIYIYKIIGRDTCLFDCATEGTYGEFFMDRDNTTSVFFS